MSDERKTPRPDGALAAEYVLGVLPHAERQAFAERLEHDAALREEVKFWTERFSPLADEVEAVEPPGTVLSAVEDRLFGKSPAQTGWWASLAFWRGLAIASLAALVIVGIFSAYPPGPAPETPSFVAELTGETGAVRLVALYEPEKGLLKLNRTEGSPQSGRDFELWLIEGGNSPISLGVLATGNKTIVSVPPQLRNRFAGAVLAITDEPQGGSPDGKPTGQVVASGAVAEI